MLVPNKRVFRIPVNYVNHKRVDLTINGWNAPRLSRNNPARTFPSLAMVSDWLIPPLFDLRTHLVHPSIHQPQTSDDNNVSLSINRESSILKLNRLVCLIMLRDCWVISLVRLTILYEAQKNEGHTPAIH